MFFEKQILESYVISKYFVKYFKLKDKDWIKIGRIKIYTKNRFLFFKSELL